MGFLNARPKLKPNETIRWKVLANRVVSKWATSGGQLVVTDQRIFFQPNRLDLAIRQKSWECPINGVKSIEIADRDRAVLAGGVRRRLGIKTDNGIEIFVVSRLEKKIEGLRSLLGQ